MNILIFGKDGQLGRAFQEQIKYLVFQRGNTIRFVGRNECDLKDPSQITNLLHAFNPQLIINAAAYTAVDRAEAESDLAFAINTQAPEVMAIYAARKGATLLHFSTDYVFDGFKKSSYTERDATNPLCIYGKSKEAGERAIIDAFNNGPGQYAILRTSWVYGDGSNFISTILRLAKERSELRVIHDQYGVATSAKWLAEVGCYLTVDNNKLRLFRSGIYHAVPRGEISWHGLAYLVVQTAMDAGITLQASSDSIVPISSSDYPRSAPRPMNSRLATDKLQFELERLGIVSKLPHWSTPWDEQVIAYIKQVSSDQLNAPLNK
jgi:dTDP-4-dehydrorhamnose reductase